MAEAVVLSFLVSETRATAAFRVQFSWTILDVWLNVWWILPCLFLLMKKELREVNSDGKSMVYQVPSSDP